MRNAFWVLMLYGCSKPEESRTTEIASQAYAAQQLAAICADLASTGDIVRGGTADDHRLSDRSLCELSLDRAKEKVIGELWIEMEGTITPRRGFCSLHLGPARVDEAVSPTIVENFVQSPVLKQHIDERLKNIDISKEYSLQTTTDGLQLDIVQHAVHVAGRRGIVIDFRLDGCAQLPDTIPEQLKYGAQVQ